VFWEVVHCTTGCEVGGLAVLASRAFFLGLGENPGVLLLAKLMAALFGSFSN